MAFGFTARPSYGSTNPYAQGLQGVNPPAESYFNGPDGTQGVASSSFAAPQSGGASSPTPTRGGTGAAAGTPVMSNGLIPPAAVPQAPAQPTITQTPTAPTGPWTAADYTAGLLPETTNFSWGSGGAAGADMNAAAGSTVGWTPQQWADYNNKYHPRTAASPTPAAGGAPAAAPFDPTKLQQAPAPTYTPAVFSQFQNPTNPQIDTTADQLMLGVLNNPLTMNQQHVSMLQEQAKEGVLAQQQALQNALTQQRAQSGFAPGGGMEQAGARRISDATGAALTGANRDIELEKLARDRADTLQAIQAGSAYQGNRLNQGIAGYGATLQGQQAQAGQDYQGYASQADNYNNANDVALRAQALALQKALGEGGLSNESARLAESGRQYNLGYGLNQAQLLNEMLMGRLNYGLGLGNLGQNAQNQMFNTIFG